MRNNSSYYTPEFFTEKEFNRCFPPCSLKDMDDSFMWSLDNARRSAGIPFVINSAFRTVQFEKLRGRDGTSSHCAGLAVDIRCNTSVNRLKILKALIEEGFQRIGIADSFIHVDSDWKKPACIWLYSPDKKEGD